MLWSRKPTTPVHEKARRAGLDLTASRVRAVSVGGGKVRTLVLDEPAEELALAVALDRRLPEVGRVGVGLCRRLPHLVCANFLPALGQPREWRGGRHALTAETALQAAFERAARPVTAETGAVAVALPA